MSHTNYPADLTSVFICPREMRILIYKKRLYTSMEAFFLTAPKLEAAQLFIDR